MGFFDRFEDAAGGVVSALSETTGLIADLVTSFGNDDDEYNGFWNTLQERGLQRVGAAVDGLFGPDQGLGALIGGLPESARSPVGSVLDVANRNLESAYRNAIGEPISTAMTAASLASSPTYRDAEGVGSETRGFFRWDTWRDAYEIAQTRSPGQAIYLAFTTRDVLDEGELARVVNSDAYFMMTGVIDGVFRWVLDPLIIGGKAAKLTRINTWIKPIRGASAIEVAQNVDRYMEGARSQRVLGRVRELREELSAFTSVADDVADARLPTTVLGAPGARGRELMAGKLRTELFGAYDDADAQLASVLLARADSDLDAELVLRVLHGDTRALRQLKDSNSSLHADLTVSMLNRSEVNAYAGSNLGEHIQLSFFNDSDVTVGLDAQAAQVADEVSLMSKLETMSAAFRERPVRVSATQQVASAITGSMTFQQSWWTRPVHMAVTHRAPRIIQLDAMDADVGLSRLMRQARVFSGDEMAQYRGSFLAGNAADRAEIIERVETQALERLAAEAGLKTDDVRLIANGAHNGRRLATNRLRSWAYSADPNMAILHEHDGAHVAPLAAVQAPSAVAVSDFYEVRRALTRYGQFKREHPGFKFAVELPGDIIDLATSAWRTAVLLRPGRPMRSLLFDEQLRVLAKINSSAEFLQYLKSEAAGARNFLATVTPKMNEARALATAGDDPAAIEAALRAVRRRQNRVGAAVGGTLAATAGGGVSSMVLGGMIGGFAGPVGVAAGAAAGAWTARRVGKVAATGFQSLDPSVAGLRLSPAFGTAYDFDNMYRARASSHQNLLGFLRDTESRFLTGLRQSGRWESIGGAHPGYADAWNRVVNRQFANDAVFRKLLAGGSVDDVSRWIVGTPEGIAYYRQIPVRRHVIERDGIEYVRGWVANLKGMVDSYTMNNGQVKAAALQGKADVSMLNSMTKGNAALLPEIHAEVLDQVMGRGKLAQAWSDMLGKLFFYMDSAPMDELGRNPFIARVYAAEIKSRLEPFIDESGNITLSQEKILAVQEAARNKAIAAAKDLFYDYADRTELHQFLRNVIPFLPATQDAVTTWAGIAIEHPDNVARIAMGYGALASDMPQFTEGDPAEREPQTPIYVVKDDLGREAIRFRLPEWASALAEDTIFESAFDNQGYAQFDRRSLNMILPTDMGAGPFVQLAVSRAVREMPEWEESVRFVLPFGPVSADLAPIATPLGEVGIPQFLLPATLQRVAASDAGEDSRAYAAMYAQVLNSKIAKLHESGERPDFTDPKVRATILKQVEDETKAVFRVRTVAAFLSPAPVTFVSPYQAYIDEYRRMFREYGVDKADNEFLAKYGEELFQLTQRFTRSNDGVPSTVAGLRARETYASLVNKYPEYGRLIVGDDGGGVSSQFSRSVYDQQLTTPVTPGSDVMQREPVSRMELVTNRDVRLGWIAYSRMRDALDAAMVERGLTNLRSEEAADLREMRDGMLLAMGERYPAWWNEYNQPANRLRDDQRIEAMREMSSDPLLRDRPDMQGVAAYIEARDALMVELRARRAAGGSGELTAQSNADLAEMWEAIVTQLRTALPWSLEFADLHSRYLARDVPSVSQEALTV